MKRGSEGREKSSKKLNDRSTDQTSKSKGEGYSSEPENNNVDIKMEVDTPEFLNCKGENGEVGTPEKTPSEQVCESSEIVEPTSEEKSDGEGKVTNGPFYFSVPTLTKRNVTLQMLLAAGILKPGEGTMSLEYHGQKFVGDLLENGQIKSQETSQIFSSPSAWAIACKQIINPEKIQRKSGCGWASIKYRSLKLDYYKTVWFKRVREGSIDIKNISNGATSSSDDSDDDGIPHCVLKFGEHFDSCPSYQSAVISGAKVSRLYIVGEEAK
ncbi:unnamed protein product [Allacma fusca]|uniref:RAMA domain-containing protein n=1 Tax=Allacma fusca TaxID=39272 RepID=A0A8J2M7M7_9HEXA|nr:unnamed protein product [Allacma fusca]